MAFYFNLFLNVLSCRMNGFLKISYFFIVFISYFSFFSCSPGNDQNLVVPEESYVQTVSLDEKKIQPGAEQLALYYPLIKDKKVGLVVNQSSRIGNKHLVDSLLELEVNIQSIFAPEHGFRGEADAGEHIQSGVDSQTGISIYSLYGRNKKPSDDQLQNIEIMIFDIQDVGVRFYTYISTLHYIMESCAEKDIPLIILDRPNPNGFYVDGPVLNKEYSSFVGMHEVPIVYGMTIGEYGKMINGESWLNNGISCDLNVIPCVNYNHKMTYNLPVKPSPNLPNLRSILLYPSICFFEGTPISIGRGTDKQFQLIGHPDLIEYDFSFTPEPKPGASNPKLNGKQCFGIDLSSYSIDYLKGNAKLDLTWLMKIYQAFPHKAEFFNKNLFFDKLAGNNQLREQLKNGLSEKEIRQSWEDELSKFKMKRRQYLLYEDF